MSYHRGKWQGPQAMGLSWSDITGALTKGASALQTAADVATAAPGVIDAVQGVIADPYLKEVACNVGRLKSLQSGQYPGPPCAPTTGVIDPKKGIGLKNAITPLHAAIFVKQNPWVLPLIAGAVLGLPFFLGVAVGKRRGR